jgi:hypothetical protein
MDQEKIDALKGVSTDELELEFLSPEMKDDKDIVFAAVNVNSYAAWYASPRLWGNKEFVLFVLDNYETDDYNEPSILSMVSKELLNDKDIIIAAAERSHRTVHGYALNYASESLKDDKDVVLITVKYIGYSLKYASESLRDDKDVVIAAVQNDGWALKYASENLQNDRNIVLIAVNREGYSLRYASESLKDDREIALVAIKRCIDAFQYSSENLRNDEYFLYYVNKIRNIKINSLNFRYLSERIQEEIKKDIDYLDRFEPVYLKPAIYKI